ncbi:MAG TPA: CoA pyrophosphatase [Mycobacteriales bacterium]|nr:CoA pyrophosphatase [Mycobacteriales bacterium]
MTALPDWLRPLADAVPTVPASYWSRFLPPDGERRMSAVLALFGEGEHGPDLLFIERAHTLRSHAGQPAFPGGKVDPEDETPVHAALREAREEAGVDPASVEVFDTLPPLFLPPSGFTVVTVLGWWRAPHAVAPVDPGEVAAVERVPLAELADPANRCEVGLSNGWRGPGFRVRGLLVWGFTAGLVDKLLALGGWERPWGPGPLLPRPAVPEPMVEEVAGGG